MSKKLAPIHPGEHLREEFMVPLGLSSNVLARFFNTSHQFWLDLQSNYDVQCAQDAAGRAIERIQPWQGTVETEEVA
jgi:plasmid maintenance system antidote protein VapI